MRPQLLPSEVADDGGFHPETHLSVPQSAIFMLYLTIFMDNLSATISTPAMPYYAREFGADDRGIGYLFAAWSLTSTFCASMLGVLSDRFGRKRILVLSLLGAGIANIGQASATSYWQLLAWRAFSGIWAAVSSTAQVYVTDVCGSAEVRNDVMAKLSAMPGLAMIFGPGLGGGLSKFGLNFPILVDGALSLACAGLVCIYLPESPAWASASRGSSGQEETQTQKKKENPFSRRSVYLLGFSGFLFGITFGTRVSMLVVALHAKLGWDALQVGYLFVCFSLVMLMQTVWLTPRIQKRFGVFAMATAGTVIQAVFGYVSLALTSSWFACTLGLTVANMGFSGRMAANGPVSATLTDPTNRGTVFATIQMMTNFGRMVGPVLAGNLAESDPLGLPWLMSGACGLLSALVLAVVQRSSAGNLEKTTKMRQPLLVRGFTDLSEIQTEREVEQGTAEDFEKVGAFVGQLLQERRYPWISHQDAVLKLVDKLLPPLRPEGTDSVRDLEMLMVSAKYLEGEFAKHGGDRQHF